MSDWSFLAILFWVVYLVHGYDIKQAWRGWRSKPSRREVKELMKELDRI